jgi:hypothetical protein
VSVVLNVHRPGPGAPIHRRARLRTFKAKKVESGLPTFTNTFFRKSSHAERQSTHEFGEGNISSGEAVIAAVDASQETNR